MRRTSLAYPGGRCHTNSGEFCGAAAPWVSDEVQVLVCTAVGARSAASCILEHVV